MWNILFVSVIFATNVNLPHSLLTVLYGKQDFLVSALYRHLLWTKNRLPCNQTKCSSVNGNLLKSNCSEIQQSQFVKYHYAFSQVGKFVIQVLFKRICIKFWSHILHSPICRIRTGRTRGRGRHKIWKFLPCPDSGLLRQVNLKIFCSVLRPKSKYNR